MIDQLLKLAADFTGIWGNSSESNSNQAQLAEVGLLDGGL
jgi:hypothetical protein